MLRITPKFRCIVLVTSLGASLGLAGCATPGQQIAQKENMLAAAGFNMKPADTPAKLTNLQTLPPQQMVVRSREGKPYYLYADPTVCQCLYVGDEKAYQTYQRMAFEQRIVDQQQMAAEMNESAAMDWGMWGPVW